MPSPLATVYSSIDSAKRKVMDALMNPRATLENLVAEKNADAGAHLDDLRHMPMPGQLPQPGGNDAKERVLTALAEGYNPGGIFVGARAKGIDNIALAYAMKDARKGVHPAQIWKDRGWGRGPDGNWRTELDDSQAQLKLMGREGGDQRTPFNQYYQLSGGRVGGGMQTRQADELFQHPELYKAYPELKNNRVEGFVDPNFSPQQLGASFSPANKIFKPSIDVRAHTPAQANQFSLHEFQHAIQEIENWQGGGSPNSFRTSDPKQAFRLYQRLGGEAEARLTEYRAGYRPETRREIFPWDPNYFEAGTGVDLPDLILGRLKGAAGP